jgi:hypothetical protein
VCPAKRLAALAFLAGALISGRARADDLIHEQFANNVNGWTLASDAARYAQIERHRFVFECLSDKTEIRTVPLRVREDEWTAEMTMTFTKAKERSGAGMVLGQKDVNNTATLEIDAYGNYSFWTSSNGVWNNLTGWQPANALKKGVNVSNTLAVRKVGSQFFIDLNGQNVDRVKAVDLFGPWWGFIVAERQAIEVSSFRVSERTPDKGGVVFDEPFTGSHSSWSMINDGHRKFAFENGRIVHENDVENGDVRTTAVRLHEDEWRIDLTFTFARVTDEKNVPNGLVFGVSDVFHMLSFVVDAQGNYCYEIEKDSTWTNVTGWQFSEAVHQGAGATNTLTVRKVGDRFFLDINGTNVDRVKASDLFGSYMGMYTWTNFRNEISRFRVTETAKSASEIPAARAAEPEKREPAAKAEPNKKKMTIAVFAVEDVSRRLGKSLPTQLAEYLGTLLMKKGGYALIPQDHLQKRLATTKAESYRSCYDNACQIELGKALAAEGVVNTKILHVGGTCAITSTLYDLKTESAVKAATAETTCNERDLLGALKSIADQL